MNRLLLSLFLIIILSSCSAIKLNYNRNKILNRYSENYQVYLDSTLINLENYYLDKDNIKSTILKKQEKSIFIERDSLVEFLEFKEFFEELENDKLVIINGVPIETEKLKNLKVSPKPLVEVILLKNDALNSNFYSCRSNKGVLIFKIKE